MVAASALLLNLLVAVCPSIPYKNNFNFEIHPGFQITIMGHTNEAYREGLVSPSKKGFIINLNGENIYDGLKVLHVNPRFDENSTMVLNTKYNYEWGLEERYLNHQMAVDQDFILVIQAHESEFKIFVNGRHFANYEYRQPLSAVTGISIKGLVTVYQVIAKQYEFSALPVPEHYTPSDVVVQKGFPIVLNSPAIPLEIPIPGQMRAGMVLALEGTPYGWFSVNWLTENNEWAFHLNPRLNKNPIVVMNTYFNGLWGERDVVGKSPFQVNKKFHLFVKTHLTHYEVWVNGEHYHDYKHRQIPPQNVTKIGIYHQSGIQVDRVTITY